MKNSGCKLSLYLTLKGVHIKQLLLKEPNSGLEIGSDITPCFIRLATSN